MRARPFFAVVSATLACSMLFAGTPGWADETEPAEDEVAYSDIEVHPWAAPAIRFTAIRHDWLRFSGPEFKPDRPLRRWELARAALRAFAPEAPLDPELSFTDVLAESAIGKYANRAVTLGWFPKTEVFNPSGPVNKRLLARVLVLALGMGESVRALNSIATEDGYRFKRPPGFAYLVLANELHLNKNFESPNDVLDLLPGETVSRGYAAVAFKNASDVGWQAYEAQRFVGITLPTMSPKRKQIVEFALRWAGYPYIYAAEWHRATSSQPKGGFDCSGFQWWVAHDASDGFDNTHVRPYRGWDVDQRRASLIAREAPTERRVRKAANLLPGDLVFFDAGTSPENWRGIDHGGVALGNGWFIHSSGSRAGVTIGYLGDGSWWADAFVLGRRLFGKLPATTPA